MKGKITLNLQFNDQRLSHERQAGESLTKVTITIESRRLCMFLAISLCRKDNSFHFAGPRIVACAVLLVDIFTAKARLAYRNDGPSTTI